MDRLLKIIKETKDFAPAVLEVEAFRPDGVYSGIRAVTYNMPEILGGRFKTFAYIGMPQGETEEVPAVVLVHGGNGHAFLEWIKLWNDRGYAAIAMDLEGYYPESRNAGANWTDGTWHHGEYGVFDMGERPSPKNDSMASFLAPLEEQWMTHAVCKVILARKILQAETKISKIGIVGVSWGAVITAITLGYENRFDFVVPIYGCGYLDKNLARLGTFFRPPETQRYWLAQNRFSEVTMPCLWMGWDDDPNFSCNSNSLSYGETCRYNPKTRIALIHDLTHSHRAASECEEPYAFADWICKEGNAFPALIVHEHEVEILHAEKIQSVTQYYLEKPMTYAMFDKFGSGEHSYMTENWKSIPCEIQGTKVTYSVPDAAAEYYIGVEAESGGKRLRISSMLYQKTGGCI